MPSKNCVVVGCDTTYKDKSTIRHLFPYNDEALFSKWVQSTGNPKLKSLSVQQVRRSFVICSKHFENSFTSAGTKKLNRNAVPTLCLPADGIDGVMCLDKSESVIQHSTSTSEVTGKKKPTLGILKHLNVRRRVDLTPRKGLIYDALKEAKKKNSLLNYRYSAFKTRLRIAEKYMNDHRECLSKLNHISSTFIESQIRTQSKKPQRRRFTLDDKIFALSLFKQSGKAYRLLQKVFALPCKSSLMSLLQKIPFEAGINKNIFQHLKKTVSKIKNPLDKYCTVIFDEISLSAGLQYVPHQDRVIGFEDLGNNKSKPLFADKALTFMVRGIRKKFKQPVASMFTNSSMKSPDLVVAIKEVVQAVQSTGLVVAALLCDQASTNVAAINKLKMETKEMYVRLGKEKPTFGFEIGNQEIVPLFDPPHLLR